MLSANIPCLVKKNSIQENGAPVPRFCHLDRTAGEAQLKVGVDAMPVRHQIKQALFDFDGTLEKTEFLRQLGWLMTALRPEYVDLFGGKKALVGYAMECKEKGVGPFQKAIGASEGDHAAIIEEVANNSRHAAGMGDLEVKIDIDKFRSDRNDFVRELEKRNSFTPNRGMWEVLSFLHISKVPEMIVTNSKRATVLEALTLSVNSDDPEVAASLSGWQKLCGNNFDNLLIISIDEVKKYGLKKKESEEPFRFGSAVLALMQSRPLAEGPLVEPISPNKPTEHEYEVAAALAKFRPNSDEYTQKAIELLGDKRAIQFFDFLPDPKSVYIVEDSDTGLCAGKDYSAVFVENGIGASPEGRPFAKNLLHQSEEELLATLQKLLVFPNKGARVDFAASDLLGVCDLFRLAVEVGLNDAEKAVFRAQSRERWEELEVRLQEPEREEAAA